jgi:hypothetical protein
MPHVSPATVRDAVIAHALAVIEAFGTDRIEDRQIRASPDLIQILARLRQSRDRALARVLGPGSRNRPPPFEDVHRCMLEAIHEEQRIMAEHQLVDFHRYENIALGKTGIGIPASVALAQAARWTPFQYRAVASTLASVWLGMQYHDDVVDWEDDFKRDSAWSVRLAQAFGGHELRSSEHDSMRNVVLGSGILALMLRRSFRHFRAARRRAEALGARELAGWARSKEAYALGLADQERRNSGYAVRLHALGPWAAQVLS